MCAEGGGTSIGNSPAFAIVSFCQCLRGVGHAGFMFRAFCGAKKLATFTLQDLAQSRAVLQHGKALHLTMFTRLQGADNSLTDILID